MRTNIIAPLLALGALPAQAAPATCPAAIPMSSAAPPPDTGVVVKFLPTDIAQQLMLANERRFGRTLNPAYLNNPRVVLQLQGLLKGEKSVALVPSGMHVWPGETVSFIPYHADPHNPCAYIPPLILVWTAL
jgi:hypothetical protein